MTAPSLFKKSDVTRAASGVEAAGLRVSQVMIDRLGQIIIQIDQNQPTGKASGWDDRVKTTYSRTT